jgi:hypothetical protein
MIPSAIRTSNMENNGTSGLFPLHPDPRRLIFHPSSCIDAITTSS